MESRTSITLQRKLKQPYLIQRLLAPGNNTIWNFGCGYQNGGLGEEAMSLLNPIFSFDRMGAAEFEFGAVPEAFQKIAQEIEDYTAVTIKVVKKEVYLICHKDIVKDASVWIKSKAKKEFDGHHTKEFVGLQFALSEEDDRIKGWLDLENAFMFFTDIEMFEKTRSLFFESKSTKC